MIIPEQRRRICVSTQTALDADADTAALQFELADLAFIQNVHQIADFLEVPRASGRNLTATPCVLLGH
jgi:hypothetical protein